MKIWTPKMKEMQIEMFGDAYPLCSSLVHYTKEILKNTKEHFWKSVFWNFKLFNRFKNYLMALVRIPEALTDLLTPILPYVVITFAVCQMRHLCQKCWKCRIWHACHPTYVKYKYGNMGVKRCIRTSGMQTNAIKQLLNRFSSLKCPNSDF